MSSAHRPTWDPAKGRADERHKSARVSSREMPSHTKLKFRLPHQDDRVQSVDTRRDLKRELELAEREHVIRKRREQGLAPVDVAVEDGQEHSAIGGEEVTQEAQRRKMIAQLKDLDADEESEEDEKQMGRADVAAGQVGSAISDSDSASDDDEDEEEDETAALMRELEKIKRERAEEKARQERERAEMEERSREEEIALGNPLLNLEHALKANQGKAGSGHGAGSGSGGYGVKRRWDDDVIFKNQAVGNEGSDKTGFVNDLTRSEFHKRFMQRYVR